MASSARSRLIAHVMAVIAIPPGTPNPVQAGMDLFLGSKLGQTYQAASNWIDDAWKLMQSTPNNIYNSEEEFITDLLAETEARHEKELNRGKDHSN